MLIKHADLVAEPRLPTWADYSLVDVFVKAMLKPEAFPSNCRRRIETLFFTAAAFSSGQRSVEMVGRPSRRSTSDPGKIHRLRWSHVKFILRRSAPGKPNDVAFKIPLIDLRNPEDQG